MTGSRGRNRGAGRGLAAGFCACLSVFLIAPAVQAQDETAAEVETAPEASPPESEMPSGPVNILPGPSVAPPEDRETGEAEEPQATFETQESGVQIGRLEAPDPSSIGTLNEKTGGFPWALWQGSDRNLVRRLLGHLPAPFQTPVLQDLSRRLLLSAAAVPEARTPMIEEGSAPPSLLSLRIDRLAAGGQLREIVDLLDRVSSYSQGDVLEKQRVNALLLLQETERVCDIADAAVRRSDDPYWLRVAAYCRARAGEVDSVGRTLDLLAEVRDAEDSAFQALISQMLLGESGSLPADVSLRDPSPLTFSMARTLDIALPPDVLLTADPMILRAVATAENASLPVRLGAAEQAAMFGALPLDRLSDLYAKVAFTEKEIAAGRDALAGMDGARANAFLYQQVQASTDARTRLDYLKTAWRRARQEGQYALIARVHLNATRAIEPAARFIPDAGQIVRALLLGGAVDRAAEWYEIVRQTASPQNIEATSTLLDIWPLFHLAAPDSGVPFTDNILRLWWQAQVTSTEAERVRRGRLLFSLLEAMEYDVPEAFWTAVVAEPMRMNDPVPTVSLWRVLLRAGQAGRMGETLLASLNGLGNAGLTSTSLSALSSIIGQWRAVGLEAEARRLAVAAAILRGL